MALFGCMVTLVVFFTTCNALSKLDTQEQLEQAASQEARPETHVPLKKAFAQSWGDNISNHGHKAPPAPVTVPGKSPQTPIAEHGVSSHSSHIAGANASLNARKHGDKHHKGRSASSSSTGNSTSNRTASFNSESLGVTAEHTYDNDSANSSGGVSNSAAVRPEQDDQVTNSSNDSDYIDADVSSAQREHQCILVCSVFPSDLVLFSDDLAENVSLIFKTCRHIDLPNISAVTLQFKAVAKVVGSFTITATANEQRTMALAIFASAQDSDSAEFQSHQFRPHENAEVAVFSSTSAAESVKQVDENGNQTAEQASTKKNMTSEPPAGITIWSDQTFEDLPLNAVVSMAPGEYRIEAGQHSHSFIAKTSGSYVVLVVGDDPADEDVVIYTASSFAGHSTYCSLFLIVVLMLRDL